MPSHDGGAGAVSNLHTHLSRRDLLKAGLSVLVGPLLPGCLPGSSAPKVRSSVSPRLTARPGTPTASPTPGLSPLGLESGRDGLLYVPQGYASDTPLPLFVAMHGFGGSASFWSPYEARAEARGFILLAVDSRGTTWDTAEGVFGDDVAFVDRALKHTFECCRIDPAHIALAGFSDGATCALSLGLANGDLFTHLAGFSPPSLLLTSDPVGTPLIFISHGRSDTVVDLRVTRDVIVPYLRSHGYSAVYRVFQGGHNLPGAISETALDWFSGAMLCAPTEVDNCDLYDEPLQARSRDSA